jgi:hypothetical protein
MLHDANEYSARMQSFDCGDRVTVRHTDRTHALGIAGWHGEIVGASY